MAFSHPDRQFAECARRFQGKCFASSRIVDLNHTCAESVCILGCHVITILSLPSTAGASRSLISLLRNSRTAIERGTVAIMFVTAATRVATVMRHYEWTVPLLAYCCQVFLQRSLDSTDDEDEAKEREHREYFYESGRPGNRLFAGGFADPDERRAARRHSRLGDGVCGSRRSSERGFGGNDRYAVEPERNSRFPENPGSQ